MEWFDAVHQEHDLFLAGQTKKCKQGLLHLLIIKVNITVVKAKGIGHSLYGIGIVAVIAVEVTKFGQHGVACAFVVVNPCTKRQESSNLNASVGRMSKTETCFATNPFFGLVERIVGFGFAA